MKILPRLLCCFGLAACGSSAPLLQSNLMQAPALFANQEIDPFTSKGPDRGKLLYVTQRQPSLDPERSYGDEPSQVLRVGTANVDIASPTQLQTNLFQLTLGSDRADPLSIGVSEVSETGPLVATRHPAVDPTLFGSDAEKVDQAFADLLNNQIAAAESDDIVIYVHGVRADFENPLLISGELRHFMGYRTTAIAYSWPSSTSPLAYLQDGEDSESSSFLFRRFIKYLAQNTDARRIHVIGYSAGTRMVLESIGEFALEYTDKSESQIQRDLKLGEVILISSDANPNKIGTYLIEGVSRVVNGLTLYVSAEDSALALSERIFGGRSRLGQLTSEQLPDHIQTFLQRYEKLTIIDVTAADQSTAINGHQYLRESPWVSSDIIAYLAFGLSAAERGLTPPNDTHVWQFPADYPERVRRAVLEARPDIAASN